MYARIVKFTLGSGTRDDATAMADKFYPITKALPGFVSATYFIHDEQAGDYGSVTVWQTKADAESAAEKLGAHMKEQYGQMLKGPPEIHTAEVYRPG